MPRVLRDRPLVLAVLLLLVTGVPARADEDPFEPQPYVRVYTDPPHDNVVRRTSAGPSPVNPDAHIDLLEYRIGNYAPTDPNVSLFDGQVGDPAGYYFRLDLRFDGLVNPAGPVKRDCDGGTWVAYTPFLYGPNPLLGSIQFNVDRNINTGGTGETDWKPYKYLGNVGRFGFRAYSLNGGSYSWRSATNYNDSATTDFYHPPQTCRHGADLQLVFEIAVEQLGVPVSEVAQKVVGDGDDLFEAGEKWVMQGGFVSRGTTDTSGGGLYFPTSTQVQFAHDPETDHTTVSLVFAVWQDEPPDLDFQNQCSVYELLWQDQTAAQEIPTGDPALDTILWDWQTQQPEDYLVSDLWELRMLAGTCYSTAPPDGQPFVWTDHAYAVPEDAIPRGTPGDFSGGGTVDAEDSALLCQFIAQHDGDPFWDSDGNPANGSLTVPAQAPYYDGFAMNFCLYDLNYDGIVNAADDPLAPGPLADLDADLARDAGDFALFALAMGGPKITAPPAGCGLGLFSRADFDADADVDLADFARFQQDFTGGP